MSSEPCRHEHLDGSNYRDAIKSLVTQTKVLAQCQRERDAALSDLAGCDDHLERALVTIASIRAIVADPHAALVVERVRAALEGTP